MKKKLERTLSLLCALVMIFSLVACRSSTSTPEPSSSEASTTSSNDSTQPTTEKDFSGYAIDIGTGTSGGFYYLYGFAIASALEKYIPGLTATAQVTTASTENTKRIFAGELDMGFICADIAYNASIGAGDFGENMTNIRHLISGNVQACQLVVRKGSGIKSYKDLVNKSIAVSTGNTYTQIFPGIMEGFEIPLDKMKLVALATNDCIEALRNQTVDAAFVVQAPPYAVVVDAALSTDLDILSIEDDVIDKILKDIRPYWGHMSVPAGLYNGIDHEVKTVGLVNTICVSADMEDDLAYEVLAVISEKADELKISHPDAVKFVANNDPLMGCGITVHPGAIKYYEEHGVNVPSNFVPKAK